MTSFNKISKGIVRDTDKKIKENSRKKNLPEAPKIIPVKQ